MDHPLALSDSQLDLLHRLRVAVGTGWADLPPPLLEKLMAERERRGRTVCKLQDQRGEAVAEASSAHERRVS